VEREITLNRLHWHQNDSNAGHNFGNCQGLFTLERVCSSPKAQVVVRLEEERHWKRGTNKLEWVVVQILGVNFKKRAMAH
jgi:hypothetical protein